MTVRAFGLFAVHMKMRDETVQRQEQEDAQPKADDGREKPNFPKWADSSIAGMRRLQIEAAIMTPEAKPVNPR